MVIFSFKGTDDPSGTSCCDESDGHVNECARVRVTTFQEVL